MRKYVIAALSLALTAQGALAQTPMESHPCWAAMSSLIAQWDAAAYPTPAKTEQMRVIGRDGHESTGPRVSYMETQIRLALADCEKGDQRSVERRVAIMRDLLGVNGIRSG